MWSQSARPLAVASTLRPALRVRGYCNIATPAGRNAPRFKRRATHAYLEKKERRRMRRIEKNAGKPLDLPEYISAKGLSAKLGVRAVDVIKILIKLDIAPNSSEEWLLPEVVDLVVSEFQRVPNRIVQDRDIHPSPPAQPSDGFPVRPPVITIIGHVNHGKTTLLDTLRKSRKKVVDSEAGGITQHVGAFSIKFGKANLTFLDTPGHSAFEGIRERGANHADIAILVVDVTRGVQPQTRTSIKYLLEANIPVIVALNKSDKPGGKPKRTKKQLEAEGLHLEENGGTAQTVAISALKGKGIKELQEMLLTQAEMLQLTANRQCSAEIDVVETKVDKYRGAYVTGIVRCGTLRKRDQIIFGHSVGKVKNVYDSDGSVVKDALPGMAVQFNGFDTKGELPQPGSVVIVVPDLALARLTVNFRQKRDKEAARTSKQLSDQDAENDELYDEQQDRLYAIENALEPDAYVAQQKELRANSGLPQVPVIVRGDVAGSVEAVTGWLRDLPGNRLDIRVISAEVGTVGTRDLALAAQRARKPIILGLGIDVPLEVKAEATRLDVRIVTFPIIYTLMKWMLSYLTSHLPKITVYHVLGVARVQSLFPMKKGGRKVVVAGCIVTSGKLTRGKEMRVMRRPDDETTAQALEEDEELEEREVFAMGKVRQLRHLRDEVTEVQTGVECGVLADLDIDYELGDEIECLEATLETQHFDEFEDEEEE
eukprot:TRINITY_DN1742_c1_g1_i1.p1 TRINITY_DN1742_c1_g1~~TRINITY_DN1742_c1_g1_i1.p1  ORF type:complete len:743 (+),score=113.16 TRINITY_DN1742_c1_g1_i1:97-2229(+)